MTNWVGRLVQKAGTSWIQLRAQQQCFPFKFARQRHRLNVLVVVVVRVCCFCLCLLFVFVALPCSMFAVGLRQLLFYMFAVGLHQLLISISDLFFLYSFAIHVHAYTSWHRSSLRRARASPSAGDVLIDKMGDRSSPDSRTCISGISALNEQNKLMKNLLEFYLETD